MSIGRKAIRETIGNLKQSYFLVIYHWSKLSELNRKHLSKLLEFREKNVSITNELLHMIADQNSQVSMLLLTLGDYIKALESYVSELDDTFDKLLKNAEEKAKKEAEKQPKIPNPYE